jgi:hypothetical protein
MVDPISQTTAQPILGDPEMLQRLRHWVEPLIGKISDWSLRRLQLTIEDAARDAGMIPQYRKPSA